VGISLPVFLIGILLILVFAVMLGWLPSFGRGQTVALGWWTTGFLTKSGLKALILPSITLCMFQMALIMRLVRAEMLEVLRTDYIKFARARGLTDRAIHFGHALKNTLVPVITITGLQLGSLIAFAIITETVPGRAWTAVHQAGFCRHTGDGGLSLPCRAGLRVPQSDRRSAVLCGRSAAAHRAARSTTLTVRMGPIEHLRHDHAALTALRRDLHAHPELGFEEHRTVEVVTRELSALGVEHHSGIGKTGVVGVIRGVSSGSGRSIGLRADMDALPMHEENDFPHVSRFKGRMHGCGHDGHTTMLLGTARYLSRTRRDGTAYLIFQPVRKVSAAAGHGRRTGCSALPGRRGMRSTMARPAAGADRRATGTDDGGRRPHRDPHRRARRPRRAPAPDHRSRTRCRPYHHCGAIDRRPQRQPD
jgi:hypothetical protein